MNSSFAGMLGALVLTAVSAAPLAAADAPVPPADAPLAAADGYYTHTAARGRWPANAGADGDRRYVTATLTEADMPPPEALRAGGRDVAVFYTGWDWCEAGALMLPEWRKGLGSAFAVTVFDWPETPFLATVGGRETDLSDLSRKRVKAAGIDLMPLRGNDRSHSWPAIGLADSEGHGYALFSAVGRMDNAAMRALASAAQARHRRFLALRRRAYTLTEAGFRAAVRRGEYGLRTGADGAVTDAGGRPVTLSVFRAALLAHALTELEPNVRNTADLSRAGMQKGVFDAIRSYDPDDVSGALRRLLGQDLYKQGHAFLAEPPRGRSPEYPNGMNEAQRRAWSDSFRLRQAPKLAELTDNTRLVPLSDNELQQALLCGSNLYRGADGTSSRAYARAAVRVNPSSFWGEAARGRLLMRSEGPVTLGGGWGVRHLSAPSDGLRSADGRITLTAEDLRRQDRVDVRPGSKRFVWTLRWGNDLHLSRPGWYTLSMNVAPEISRRVPSGGLTVEHFRIYRGARGLEDGELPGRARLCFDGSAAVAARNAPTDGDTAGTFTPVAFPVTLAAGGSLRFTFYFAGADCRRPVWEKDTSSLPQYNDTALVIAGTFSGPSVGTFAVTPLQAAAPKGTPYASRIMLDGRTLSLRDAFGVQDARLAAAEPPAGTDGETVADRIEHLIASDSAYRTALARAELFYEYELPDVYRGRMTEALETCAEGRPMLEALLGDPAWLEALLASGPEGFYRRHASRHPSKGRHRTQVLPGLSKNAPARLPEDVGHDVLKRLAVLWEADSLYRRRVPDSRRGYLAEVPGMPGYDPLLRRLAAAYALNLSGAVPLSNLRTHYLTGRSFAEEGRLHGDFYTQSTAAMRFSFPSRNAHPLDLEYTVRSGNTRCDSVNATAWQMHYRTYNFFGDSIHSGRPYRSHVTLTMLPDGAVTSREIGAVCGGISNYGASCGTANGRRALTGGQPGHCAGAHRSFDGRIWNIDSNVSAPTGNHTPLWVMNHYQALEYIDDLFDDPSTVAGYRLLWASRLRARRFGARDPGVEALLRRAVLRAPLNYQALLDLSDWMNLHAAGDWDRWEHWRSAVVRGLWRYPRVAWDLLNTRWLPRVLHLRGEDGLVSELCRLYAEMKPSDRVTREAFRAADIVLFDHLRRVRSPECALQIAEAFLEDAYGSGHFVPTLHRCFVHFRNLGLGDRFYRAVEQMYARHDEPLGTRAVCLNGLFAASRRLDTAEYRAMADLQRELWPERFPPLPAPDTLPAPNSGRRLLSADGVLALRSYPRLNPRSSSLKALGDAAGDAFFLDRIIGPTADGKVFVRTRHHRGASATLRLKGDSEISRIELSPGRQAQTVRVEISTDNRDWLVVDEALQLTPGRTAAVRPKTAGVTRYVRVTSAGPGPNGHKQLTLTRFHVYGTGRY